MKRKATRKSKSVREKRGGKRAVMASRRRKAAIEPNVDTMNDALVAASARALGLSLEPAWRDSIKFNLRLILEHAARVDTFPLPDEAEPAPVFHA